MRSTQYFRLLIAGLMVFPLISTIAIQENHETSIEYVLEYPSYKNAKKNAQKANLIYENVYHNLSMVYEELNYFNNTFPKLINYRSIGKSYYNNNIPLIVLTNENIPLDTKGKTYIVAHHHAREMITIENTLRLIRDLVTGYNNNEKRIVNMLDKIAIYFIVTLNPDTIDYVLYTNEHFRKTMKPYDDDGDGLVDEDGPEDLNGDRKTSYFYLYNVTEAKTLIDWWWEGTDKDGDGLIGEDPPGGVDLNRNYPFHWNTSSLSGVTGDKTAFDYPGPEPLSENESRVLVEFVDKHKFTHALSLHSGINITLYGWSYSDHVTHPYQTTYDEIELYSETNKLLPRSFYTSNLGYTTAGEWGDYMYTRWGIHSVTFELFRGRSTIEGPLLIIEENETHQLFEKKFYDFDFFNPKASKLELLHEDVVDFELFWLELTPKLNLTKISKSKLFNGDLELKIHLSSGSMFLNTPDIPQITYDQSSSTLIRSISEISKVLEPEKNKPITIIVNPEFNDGDILKLNITSDYASDLMISVILNKDEFKSVNFSDTLFSIVTLTVLVVFIKFRKYRN